MCYKRGALREFSVGIRLKMKRGHTHFDKLKYDDRRLNRTQWQVSTGVNLKKTQNIKRLVLFITENDFYVIYIYITRCGEWTVKAFLSLYDVHDSSSNGCASVKGPLKPKR